MSNSNKPVCKYFQRGNCAKGNSCRFYHPNGSTGLDNGSKNFLKAEFLSSNSITPLAEAVKKGLKDYQLMDPKSLFSSFGLEEPSRGNVIANRDLSYEEQRWKWVEATKNGTISAYEKEMYARQKDMEYCINELKDKESLAARYLQYATEKPEVIPQSFIKKSLEENIQSFSSNNGTFGSGFGSSAFGNTLSNSFGGQYAQPGAFGTTSNAFGPKNTAGAFGKPSAFGTTSTSNPFGVSTNSGAFGTQNSGNSAFGSQNSGNSAFGSQNSGASPFGAAKPAALGFGSSGFGSSSTGSSGGPFGSSSTNQGGAFGTSGFGSSSFGSLGNVFGNQKAGGAFGTQNTTSPFGTQNSTQPSSVFGQTVQNNPGQTTQPAQTGGSFGQSSFGQAKTSGSSGFGSSGFGSSGFGSQAFGASSGTGNLLFGGGFGAAANKDLPFGNSAPKDLPFSAAANKPLQSGTTSIKDLPFGATSASQPFGSSGNLTFGGSAFGTSNNNPFGSTQSPFGSTKALPFGAQTGNSVFGTLDANSGPKPPKDISSFGSITGSQASAPSFGAPSSTPLAGNGSDSQALESVYIDTLEKYADEVRAQFLAQAFDLGKVPDVPPTQELSAW